MMKLNQNKKIVLKELKNVYPHLYTIIAKMFEIINVPKKEYDNLIINDNNNAWYEKYMWTTQQQEEYKKRLYNYLKNNKKALKELTGHPYFFKEHLEKIIDNFILFYGLNIK